MAARSEALVPWAQDEAECRREMAPQDYNTEKNINLFKCRAASLPPNQLIPFIPSSSAMITAASSLITSTVEYILQQRVGGRVDKLGTLGP